MTKDVTKMMNDDELIEKLSDLEHEQWMKWAKTLMSKETLSDKRISRWEECFVPYSELTDEMQEYDRVWARKVLEVIRKTHIFDFKHKDFWKSIIYTGDKLDENKVLAELHDYQFMLEAVPEIYMEVTGGKISKPNTCASAVIDCFTDHVNDLVEQSIDDMGPDDVRDIIKKKEIEYRKLRENPTPEQEQAVKDRVERAVKALVNDEGTVNKLANYMFIATKIWFDEGWRPIDAFTTDEMVNELKNRGAREYQAPDEGWSAKGMILEVLVDDKLVMIQC